VPCARTRFPDWGHARSAVDTVYRAKKPTGRLFSHARPVRHKKRRRVVEKTVVPVEFTDGKKQEIMARYDTGTYGNHISLALATAMGYELDRSFQPSFKLPNGDHLRSTGRITAKIRFLRATSTNDKRDDISCHFITYVEEGSED
jgi:hypothetical protein